MKRYSIVLAVVACLHADPVAAQDGRLRARLDAVTADSVGMIISMAGPRGVPAEPLVQKALEGASKNASRSDILRAVAALSSRLSTARIALGTSATDGELIAAASALYEGVNAGTITRLQSLHPRESIAMPLVSLAYFLKQGVSRDRAIEWTETVVRKGIRSGDLLRLQQSIDNDIRSGAASHAATTARVEALLRSHREAPL